MSYSDIIDRINEMYADGVDQLTVIDTVDAMITEQGITEDSDIASITNRLKLDILDIDRFVKVNDFQPISDPIFFTNGYRNETGLLSDTIFGITDEERRSIFAYIDLHDYFLMPVYYKAWFKVDPIIKDVIAKNGTYSIDAKGCIIKDENGKNGIDFLRKNINKISFKRATKNKNPEIDLQELKDYNEENDTDLTMEEYEKLKENMSGSVRKSIKIKFLLNNKNKAFTNKYIVIPPAYRDVNMQDSKKGTVGVGKINELYRQLITISNQLDETQEYGFDLSGPSELRMQETLLQIYDWFCGTNNANIQDNETGSGISGKFGVLRRANRSKTTDYAARLVITAPNLKANTPKDMVANFDHSFVPLASAIACFAPFVQFAMRRYFEREFQGTETMQFADYKTMKPTTGIPKDPMIQFSDERLQAEMRQFIKGYNNRLIPITVELEDGKKVFLSFKGSYKNGNSPETIYHRRLTWLDVLYQATVEATRNKMVLISRFPIDSRTNEITTGIIVASTNETEPMYVNGEYYPYYPKFSENDIGKNTSDMFRDTLNMSNLYLAGLGGD